MSDGVTQDGGDGKWRDSKGNVYNTFSEAKASNDGGGGSSGGGGGAGGGGIIVLILLAIPAIIAKVVSSIFGVLFKLWLPGKLIQTIILSAFVTSFIVSGFLGFVIYYLTYDTIIMVSASIFLITAFWYWLFHYDEIKKCPIKEFSNAFTAGFAIMFYGGIVLILIGGLIAVIFGETAGRIIGMTLLTALLVVAIFVYLGKVSSYREEAIRNRTFVKLKKTILCAAAISLAVLTAFVVLANIGGKSFLFDKEGNLIAGSSGDKVYEGDFVKGEMTGIGKMTYASGTVEEGRWKDGEFLSK